MRYRSLICSVTLTILVIFGISPDTRSQSGRGRPRVPTPSQPANPQPSVKIPESTVVVRQEQAGNAARFVLRNGMTVLLSEQHTQPYAVAVAYFKTKRLSELEYNSGRALQKALIAGDLLSAPFKSAGAIRTLGGELTAEVGRDHSYFCILISSKNINNGLASQAEMLVHPSWSAEGARRAVLAIDAENARGCENPADYSNDRMLALAASNLAGGASVPGDVTAATSQARLSDFYKAYYRPDNLVLSVVGDISTFDTLVQIERVYADFGAAETNGEAGDKAGITPVPNTGLTVASHAGATRAPEPSAQRDSLGESSGLLYLENRGKMSQSIVTVGYRAAGMRSDDWPALEVLTSLLGEGHGSALNLTLFLNQGTVSRVSSDYSAGPETGLLSIQMWLPPAAIDKAEASLFKEIDRIIKAQPDPSEIARAKAVTELRLNEKVETFMGAALVMAEQGAATESIPTAAMLISRIRSVRPEDVQFVAAKYLALSNASVHEYEPLAAPARTFDSASFARTAVSWAPGLAQSPGINQTPKPPATPVAKLSEKEKAARNEAEAEVQNVQPLPVKDFSTLNGPKVFVREDHSRPRVTIAILFQGGRITETEANAGITNLMLRLLLYGTPRVTREQAAMTLDKLGANARLITETDYFGVALTCLSSNAGEALRLVRELIEGASFRDLDVERARQEQLGWIRAMRDSGREQSRALLLEAMFPGHPYGMAPYGLETTVEKLKADDLRDWYSKTIKSQFPLVIIVGDTDGSALVSEGIAGEFKRRDLADTIKAQIPGRPSNSEKNEQGQCAVTIQYLGFPGPKRESNDLPAIELIRESLNGAGGGFEEDLVYKQGVGWAVGLGYKAMATSGVLYAGIESAPDDRQRVRAATISKLQQISANGLPAGELQGARDLAVTSTLHALAGQELRALTYAEALYSRREASYVDSLPDAVASVTASDVKRVAAAYFKPSGFSVGMVEGTGSAKQGPPAQ